LPPATRFKTHRGDVIVLYGDTPLICPETLAKMREALTTGGDMAVLGFMAQDPAGYGRLIMDGNG
jgi:bifunctional UDP-N-acetylglucosamine pyrophosphorylase / glucosamine-1-phosphate N-acetyltransferase